MVFDTDTYDWRPEGTFDWSGALNLTPRQLSPGPPQERSTAEAFEQAVSLHQHGRTPEAEKLYQAVLVQDPDHLGALHRLSILRLQQGAFDDALRLIRRALERDPNYSEGHNNLGVALHALDRPADALQHFEKAIAIKPGHADAHYNLGKALQMLNRFAEAAECYRRALALRTDYVDAYNNLGNVLQALNRPRDAMACFLSVLAIRPDHADAHSNLGNAFAALDRYEEAMESYARALAIRPDHADAHNNLGLALRDINRHQEAIACFEKAQTVKPDHADAQLNEGLARLALGDFDAGWRKYEWRRLLKNNNPRNPAPLRPLWLGKGELSGKTILLHGEQGLGDTLQFLRYVPHVAQRGARVILAVQRPLARLVTGLAGVSVLRAQGDTIPPFDCYCPLPSLPLAFGTTLDTIPATVPYLHIETEAWQRWKNRLAGGSGLKIGLVWAGNPAHKNDRRRSIALDQIAALFDCPGVRWFSLQSGERAGDLATLSCGRVADLSPELADFAETAAAIANLDLVITVDTATAHLAGALGKPVWVLLPFSADWRWLLHRNDSPWYPTARLYRQAAPGDWAGVVRQVEDAMRRLAP
jgi:tetratricopeptide (TPR) repeat protein